jgi:hypothetical protein
MITACVSPAASICTTNDSASMSVDAAVPWPVYATVAVAVARITVAVAAAIVAAAIPAPIDAAHYASTMTPLAGELIIINLLLSIVELLLGLIRLLRLDHCSDRCHWERCRTSNGSETGKECSS